MYFELIALVILVLAILGMFLIFSVYCISMRYNKEMTFKSKSDLDIKNQRINTDIKLDLTNRQKKCGTIRSSSTNNLKK